MPTKDNPCMTIEILISKSCASIRMQDYKDMTMATKKYALQRTRSERRLQNSSHAAFRC